ncbi:DUF1656 domain-containing protein [Sphingomonas sp. MMS24-J13]|uniref:DUF1656 domain-containing protein n=1 Tax=Sphingomonas sp. MMS24-J13 TaxID=3238686 RepID=UPI00384FA890
MIGEVSIGGVYLPALLLLALAALVLTGLLTRFFSLVGVYRLVAYRPLVDLCLFMLLLGLLALLTMPLGIHP